MKTVLIVGPDKGMRLALEVQLSELNQFDEVCSCADLFSAQAVLRESQMNVILLDAGLARTHSTLLQLIKLDNPELGVVLVREQLEALDPSILHAVGGHAQISRAAVPMEIITSVAKALAVVSKPG